MQGAALLNTLTDCLLAIVRPSPSDHGVISSILNCYCPWDGSCLSVHWRGCCHFLERGLSYPGFFFFFSFCSLFFEGLFTSLRLRNPLTFRNSTSSAPIFIHRLWKIIIFRHFLATFIQLSIFHTRPSVEFPLSSVSRPSLDGPVSHHHFLASSLLSDKLICSRWPCLRPTMKRLASRAAAQVWSVWPWHLRPLQAWRSLDEFFLELLRTLS